MCGDDSESAAPGSGGFGVAIEEALMRMEGKFIELNVAAA